METISVAFSGSSALTIFNGELDTAAATFGDPNFIVSRADFLFVQLAVLLVLTA